MCVNQHDGSLIEIREDGTRICFGCLTKYQGRKNAARRVRGKKHRAAAIAANTPYGSTNNDRNAVPV